MNLEHLEGQHVYIVGGATGIGLETARMAARYGARITIGALDDGQKDTVQNLLPDADFVTLDIRDRASVEAAFGAASAIDHLVVTAGSRIIGLLRESDPDDLLDAVRERVFGSVYVVKAALPVLSERASITLTSGLLAKRPMAPQNTFLATAVGGIESLVRGLALELQPIRVNAFAPGVTDTSFFDRVPERERQEYFDKVGKLNLVGRVGRVEDIAAAVIFLMTNEYMTGEILRIDGGTRV